MRRQEKRDRRSWRNEGKTFVEECTGVGRRKGGEREARGKVQLVVVRGEKRKSETSSLETGAWLANREAARGERTDEVANGSRGERWKR